MVEREKNNQSKTGEAVNFPLKSGELSALVHPVPELYLRLPINPNDAASKDDKFKLTSTDGKYEKVLTIKDDQVPGDEYIDLVFNNLKMNQSYTLEIDPGKEGKPYKIFENVPFSDLMAYYSLLEPGDTLKEEEEEEGSEDSSGESKGAQDSDWDNEGESGTEYGGDPDENDTGMESIMESEEPDEGEEINWDTFDPTRIKTIDDTASDEEINDLAEW